MNAKLKLILTALAFAVGPSAIAVEGVDLSLLPPAVKNRLDQTAGGAAVKEIRVRSEDGRNVYDIELERPQAPNPKLRIASDGTLMRDSRDAPESGVGAGYPEYYGTPVAVSLQVEDLPASAQQTIRKESKGREVVSIRSDAIDGRAGYIVEFRERGRNTRLYIAEDGTVLRPQEKPPVLGLGTMFDDTPTAVQQTIRREVGDGEILKIDKERRMGEAPTYRVEIKDARGTFRISVSESGQLIENTRPADRVPSKG